MTKEVLQERSRHYLPRLIEWRRHLHMHPELSEEEKETAAFVQQVLREQGIPFQAGIGGHGVLGFINGKNPEKSCIALRADMDALPIQESGDHPYVSRNPGVMHACGHDAHTASLLGAACLLQEQRDHFEGCIKLIFQPSEEKYPGGAIQMIREGVLENPAPALILGQHVLPTLASGKVGFKGGKYMASTDEIHISIEGKGGHGATPDLVIDPLLTAAHILLGMQHIVSRKSPPSIPTVISFGRLIADGQTNIIPDTAEMHGILRTMDEHWRKEAQILIKETAEHIAQSMGARCKVLIKPGYPFLVNDEKLTGQAMGWAKDYLGEEEVEALEIRMTAEDFAYYAQKIPACFYRLGIRNEEKGIVSNLHTSTFDIDEAALETGAGMMAWLAIRALESLSGDLW